MTQSTIGIGIIGCGAIFPAYVKGSRQFPFLEIKACADMDLPRAQARAREFEIPRGVSVEDLLADPEIEIVVNLTVPQSHAPLNIAALKAGKHAYCEKPLGLTRDEVIESVAIATRNGLRVGSAPDTFLGAGIQTARRAIDEGLIGEPVAATAFMAGHGHESWHPSPAFYYLKGGGPMFDMGPYYLTALVNLIGPARRVSASTRITFPTRTVTSEPLKGTVLPVEIPTHLAGTIDFQCGAIATVIMSFDVWAHNLPRIEIHGTEGSMSVPDPNTFNGEVKVRSSKSTEWKVMPSTHRDDVGRGIGVADLATAVRSGREHRANGHMAAHVVDIMQAFGESSDQGRHIELTTTCTQPAPLPAGLAAGEIDN
ncbi:MAG: Gfo/Idh/MocA family oxidoreductase [Opitutaceae bacterium]